MDIFNTIWGYVLPIGGGVTIGAILIGIGSIIIKSIVDKTFRKIDIQGIEDKAVEKGVEKIKTYTYKHSIQPLVESELEKVCEKVDNKIEKELEEVNANYKNIINCFEKFANYFDNSIGVPDTKKEELKQAIEKAKKGDLTVETVVIEEEVKETQKPSKKGVKAVTVVR